MKSKISSISSNTTTAAFAENDSASDFIPGTNWTYADAAAMAEELDLEARLFPKHRHPVSMPSRSSMTRSASFKNDFLKQTGWSWADAVDEARMTDQRSHGLRLYASV